MKLVHPNFLFQIIFEENKINNIIIESPKIFEEFIGELYEQYNGNQGRWVLSERSTPIEIKKYCELIFNPFSLDINNKKILGKLYDELKKNVTNTELYIRWNEVYPYLAETIDVLIEDFDYYFEYDNEVDIKDFFKLMNLRFAVDEVDNIDKIISYMNLHNSILGTKLFVLINIKSYFSEDRLKYLYEQAFYKKYNLLLIENYDSTIKNDNEIRYIIDKDGCVIH